MKHLFLFYLLFFIGHGAAWSQSIVGIYTDGRNFQPTDTILATDTCTFRLDNGETALWEIAVMTNSGIEIKRNSTSEAIVLELNRELFKPSRGDVASAPRRFAEGDTLFYKGFVYCTRESGEKDSLELRIRVLPPRPIVEVNDIILNKVDWIEDMSYWRIDMQLVISIYGEGYLGYLFYTSESYDSPEFDTIEFPYIYGYIVPIVPEDFLNIKTASQSADCFLVVVLYNNFGRSMPCNVGWFWQYLPEGEIKDAFYNDPLYATGLSDKNNRDKADVISENGNLFVKGTEMPLNVNVYDLNGKRVPCSIEGNQLHIETSRRGVYIINIKHNDQIITKKIQL